MHAILFITLIAVSFFAATVTSYADGPIRDVPDWPEDLPTPYGHADRVPHDGLSTYVLFSIDKTGATKVLGAKPGHHPVSPCRVLQDRHINDDSTYVLVHYKHPVDGLDCHIPISDPRKMYHDHDAGDHKFGGGIMHHDEAEFAISLHPDASDVTVSDFVTKIQTMHKVTQDHHRAFEAMDNVVTIDATKVVPTTIQIVGSMSRQKNIIFLSSGYTASQQSKFDTDVTTLLDFMQLPTNDFGVSSQPYLRYFSLFNIFKVWYPSNAVGASHPAPAGDGTSVDNNLGCSYGASSYRILTCTRAKVLLLGSYAPPDATNALYIILVNDVLFGGTGGSGVCSIYTGAKMPVVFIHEVGHASTGLSDEYNYGTTETSQVPLLNCYWSNAQTPWQGWILAGILPSPSPVCTYTNYYKPTPSTCLMESDNSAMCPVCGEAVLEHIYDVGLDLTAPRYPGPYETLVLVNGESFPLTISSKIPYRRDETGTFTTTWTVGDTVLTRGVHQLGVARQNTTSAATTLNVSSVWYYPGPGSYTITVTILDNTNIFLSSTRNTLSAGTNISSIRQVHEFRILVVADEATRSAANCSWRNSSTLSTGGYCTQCDAGHASDCSLSFSSRPLQYALDVTASLGSLQTWLLGVGGVFIIMGFIVFFLIWKSMQLQSQTRVREVLPLTEGVKRVRWVLMGTQCFMLLGTTVVIFFSVYMYSVMTVFGKTIIIGIIVTSCIVWAVSFLGFCAAYYKNRIVLFVNFALLLVLFGCALLFTLLLAYVLLNIDTPAVQDQLHTEWQNSVSNNPYDVCTLQSVLDCSGFNTSCYAVNTVVGTNDCPANCETGNLIAYPCWLRIRSFVLSQFLYATFAGGALSVFLLLCMILGLILGCKIKTQKMETNLRRKQRQARGENALTPEEVEMLLVEFKKIDKDNSGDISREEFGGFYNDVMGTALTQRQLDEYFDKLDSDGSGSLSFEEFVKIYRPIKKPKKRSLKEAQEARELARTQSESFVIPDDSNKALTPAASSIGFGGATPGTANSQRSDRGAMIDLDLQLDDDIDLFMDDEGDLGAMAHAAEEQEKAAREQAAAVAAAQAERQKRHALEQPAAVDVSNVLGDLANDLGGGGDDFGDFENMDLEIDLDNDMY